MKDKTQQQLIIETLAKGWTSPLEALYKAGTLKLSTRVGELRKAGYLILDKWHPSKKFKMYRLVKKSKKI
jgi:hypothetical protein